MDFEAALSLYSTAVARQSATMLIGAGLSQAAGYPGWGRLLEPFVAEFDADQFNDLPMLAQYVVNRDGSRDRLVSHIVGSIDAIHPTPTGDHTLLVQLPIPEIWTTNYDTLLEAADPSFAVIEQDEDFLEADRGPRRLHKMHGSIRRGADVPVGGVDGIVITRDDYDRYEQYHPRAWQVLRAQFLTKTFLFLGFSLTDPNFDAVFKLVRLATPERYIDHIALLRRADTPPVIWEARCNDLRRSGVHVVEINDFAEITTFLRALVVRTRPIRLYVSGSYPNSGGDGVSIGSDDHYPTGPEDERLTDLAERLGRALAPHRIRLAAGSTLAATVGYALAEAAGEEYEPDQTWVLRRRKREAVTPPNTRLGILRFIGSDPGELRDSAFQHIRAVAVLGGGDGTRNEVARARQQGMGVVPLAITGGTAFDIWTEMSRGLTAHSLGGAPIDANQFADLNASDPDDAIAAAVELIRAAMFLTPSPSP